jgi:hypothetical protein
MKKAAKEMLETARQLAVAIKEKTGLTAAPGLDDHLLHSFVVISGNPQFARPGQWFEYLKDAAARQALRSEGMVEFVAEIPPRQRLVRVRRIVVRLRRSLKEGQEEFVSEDIPAPLPIEVRDTLARISEAMSEVGYLVVDDTSGHESKTDRSAA